MPSLSKIMNESTNPEYPEAYGRIGGQPIIEVSRVVARNGGYDAVIDECPICGGEHRHGFDVGIEAMTKGQSKPSHRAIHGKIHSKLGYYLIYTDETENVEYDDGVGGWVFSE
jgi:hypothetical protein